MWYFDEAVAAMAAGVGSEQRMGVSVAKAELRSRGLAGQRLASRLGKLSKVRNSQAHLDAALVGHIEELLGRGLQAHGVGGTQDGLSGGVSSSTGDAKSDEEAQDEYLSVGQSSHDFGKAIVSDGSTQTAQEHYVQLLEAK